MIIDGHAHAYGEFGDPENLIKIMNQLNVDKVVLCPGMRNNPSKPPFPEFRWESKLMTHPRALLLIVNRLIRLFSLKNKNREQGNDYVYSYVQKYPQRIIQFHWVNPLKENFLDEIDWAINNRGIRGIKLHQCVIPFQNDSQAMEHIAKLAGKHDLPIFIHCYSYKEFKKLLKLIRRYPQTNFISAHLIGLELATDYAQKINNLYFDLSSYFVISKKRINLAINYFGPEKLLFGSDTPLGAKNLEKNIEKINQLEVSPKTKALILGENFRKLLSI